MKRLLSGLVLTGLSISALATVPLPVGAAVPSAERALPSHLDLPDGFQPEGIAIDGKRVLVSSRTTGDIYALNADTGRGKPFAKGPGTPSLGLKVDTKHDRLFVAGGSAGDARVLDLRTGRTLKSYQLSRETSFVNDAVVLGRAVWFTDSAQAQLYKIPLGERGGLPGAARVRTVPLTGQWRQVEGINANGITATPDGRALLVVNSTTGALFRIDKSGKDAGTATRVPLGSSLKNGDGLLLSGRTLLAVRNQNNRIAVVSLDARGRSGKVTDSLRSDDFDVPSTVAKRGDDLYLPNARFTTPPAPTTPYWVTRLRLR